MTPVSRIVLSCVEAETVAHGGGAKRGLPPLEQLQRQGKANEQPSREHADLGCYLHYGALCSIVARSASFNAVSGSAAMIG